MERKASARGPKEESATQQPQREALTDEAENTKIKTKVRIDNMPEAGDVGALVRRCECHEAGDLDIAFGNVETWVNVISNDVRQKIREVDRAITL